MTITDGQVAFSTGLPRARWSYVGDREKALKKWNRAWKIELIEKNNPAWLDLYDQTV